MTFLQGGKKEVIHMKWYLTVSETKIVNLKKYYCNVNMKSYRQEGYILKEVAYGQWQFSLSIAHVRLVGGYFQYHR
jgi:hypothetical protein